MPGERPPDPPLWGTQTHAALQNTAGHGRRTCDVPQLVRGYGLVKAAAACANASFSCLDPTVAGAVARAGEEVATGVHDDAFPLPLLQGGGGTSMNMNVNEVLASLASRVLGRPVHPNDDVNCSQSTNDTYPTAMALALLDLVDDAVHSLVVLAEALTSKAQEYEGVLRLGRTCLQDAVPLTVAQTHRAQAHAVDRAAAGLRDAASALCSVPLGGTALGTGVGAPAGFGAEAVRVLAELSGRPLRQADDLFDAMAHLDACSALAAAGARTMLLLGKFAADFRWLSSGPVGGIGELRLPVVQKGSSIMPGKVNPVIPELVLQLAFAARGAAHTVDLAVAAGELELNVMEPVILDALVTVLRCVTDAATLFADRCVAGLVWDRARLAQNLEGSLEPLVELSLQAGYDSASQAAGRTRTAGAGE